MKTIPPNRLVPGKNYFLKWKGRYFMRETLVLECQFIKYFDNSYGKDCIDYLDLTDPDNDNNNPNDPKLISLRNRLRGTILDERDRPITTYPFDHPLYPYTYPFPGGMLPQWDKETIGLFRYVRIVKLIIDGKDVTNKFNNQTLEKYLKKNDRLHGHIYSTLFSNNSGILVSNETLMWVKFGVPASVQVLEANAEQRIIHEKTLKGLEEMIGQDPTSEVAKFVGSTEYLDSLKKGGKTKKHKRKTKKGKSKRRGKR